MFDDLLEKFWFQLLITIIMVIIVAYIADGLHQKSLEKEPWPVEDYRDYY